MKLHIQETITHEVDIDIDKLKKLFEVKGWSDYDGYCYRQRDGLTAVAYYDLLNYPSQTVMKFLEYENLSYSQFIKELNEI